jgi:hypothetical protein
MIGCCVDQGNLKLRQKEGGHDDHIDDDDE